jgi:hypothetical protein
MNKKRMMFGGLKKFIYIAVAFMLMLIFLGCSATMTEQRKETYDMRGNVGNKPFAAGSVGSTFTYDRWGFIESTPY